MRTNTARLAIGVALVSLTFATTAPAQGGPHWQGDGGWGRGGGFARLYDPSKVETIRGTVARIERVAPSKGMSTGIHLQLEADQGTVSVHLGPSWFIENQDVQIETGDSIEVIGSRVEVDGAPALLAARVVKGDQVLTLRDDAGIPAWAGWRRR